MENISNYEDDTDQNINCDFESKPLREEISDHIEHISFESSSLSVTKAQNSDKKSENKKFQNNIGIFEKTMEQDDIKKNTDDNPFTNDLVFKND